MAGNPNPIVQKIVLKVDEYSANAKKASTALRSATSDINKALFESSKQFLQSEVQVRQWGQSLQSEGKKAGRALGDNILTGAKALTLGLGGKAIKKAAEDATSMAFSFSKAFAEIKSRSNASEKDLQSWRNQLMQISADTTANMDSMAESFRDMFSSVKNPNELLAIMSSIGAAAAMTDGDATKVSGFVKGTLQGQGREINRKNVDDVLGGSDLLRRHGNGFSDLGDAMGAMGSVSGQELQRSKLSQRQLAALMAGATNTGSEKGAAISGMSELISKSNNGILEGSVLAGILGTGRLTNKSGQFDISRLSKGYGHVLGMGGGNENKAREIFKATSGLQNSDAIFNLLKNFDRLNQTVRETEADQKSFGESATEARDNLENAYKGFSNNLIKGVSDILGGFEKPLKSLLGGHLGDAVSGLPGAFGGAAKGMMDHPGLVLGGIATTAIAGTLIKGVLSKIPGLGGATSLAGGVGMGKALQQMGVTPVYVVNAADISQGRGVMGADKIGSLLGQGATSAGASGVGLLGRALPFLGAAGAVGLAGLGGVAVGRGADWATDKAFGYQNKYEQHVSPFERMMAKITPEWAGGMTTDQYRDNYVRVEVISQDPGLRVIPKAGDNPRDTRSW